MSVKDFNAFVFNASKAERTSGIEEKSWGPFCSPVLDDDMFWSDESSGEDGEELEGEDGEELEIEAPPDWLSTDPPLLPQEARTATLANSASNFNTFLCISYKFLSLLFVI